MLSMYLIGAGIYIISVLSMMWYSKLKNKVAGNDPVNDIDDYEEEDSDTGTNKKGCNSFLFIGVFILGSIFLWPVFLVLQVLELLSKINNTMKSELANENSI